MRCWKPQCLRVNQIFDSISVILPKAENGIEASQVWPKTRKPLFAFLNDFK